MATRSKKKSSKPRRAPDGWRLILTAGAFMLGGLGVGLFLGTQLRSPTVPPRPPVAHAPAPPSAPATASHPAPPEHNPEAAEDVPAPAAGAPARKPEAASPPGHAPAAGGTPQTAALSFPKPPAPPAGTPPWIQHAVAATPNFGHPMIALVIDDMGLDRKRSARAAALPGPLTLSFLPYAEDLPGQTGLAHRSGHELLVHIPMEPLGSGNDPGPNALVTSLGGDEIASRLRRDLARFDGFVGINNHMGSKFTAFGPGMAVVMAELRARGLLWLDSRTSANSVGVPLAREYEVPHVERDIFLDNNPAFAAVQRELVDLEKVARRRGWAVAIGHPKDATLEALSSWLPTLAEHGFVLVPLTQIVRSVQAAG